MPYKEKEIEKIYYSIGEVAEMFQVNTSHIRFWSNEFDVIKPSTNKKGNRLFTQSDIDNLKKIYHLVKEKGFTLKGAKSELKKMSAAAREGNVKSEVQSEAQSEAQSEVQPEVRAVMQPNLFDQPSAEINPLNTLETIEEPVMEAAPSLERSVLEPAGSKSEVNIVDKIAVLNSLQKMRAALLEAHDQLTNLEEKKTYE